MSDGLTIVIVVVKGVIAWFVLMFVTAQLTHQS